MKKKSAFNALVTLNFVSLSLLVCAENCVQLITAVFITDILGYLILKDVDSSRRYVVYNFLPICACLWFWRLPAENYRAWI